VDAATGAGTLVKTGAAWPTTVVGHFVHVRTETDGFEQRRMIVGVVGTTAPLNAPWPITPMADDTFSVGLISFDWWSRLIGRNGFRSFWLDLSLMLRDTDDVIRLDFYNDRTQEPVVTKTPTVANMISGIGDSLVRTRIGVRARHLSWRVRRLTAASTGISIHDAALRYRVKNLR